MTSGQLHTPAALYWIRSLGIFPGQGIGWAAELVWMLSRRENLLSLPRIEPRYLGHADHS